MKRVLSKLFATSVLASVSIFSTAAEESNLNAPQLSSKNIDKVVSAMTLEEKAALLVGLIKDNSYVGVPTENNVNSGDLVPGAAGETVAIPRFGIPRTVVADGPAGLRIQPNRQGTEETFYCTAFPTGTSLASTWDQDLMYNVGKAMGAEVKEYGVDVLLGPGLNLMRNPLCGRNFEYMSEDPVLGGEMAGSIINGIQSQGVGVSLKHFVANNQEEDRMNNSVVADGRTLRELYFKSFEIAIKKSNPWTIMSSYNKINGVYTQEDKKLLTNILRNEWGYKGIVMTDWTGQRNTPAQVEAGNDLMMPGNRSQINHIISAVNAGELSMEAVDKCVKRILEYIVKTPRFNKYEYSNKPDLKANAAVARNAAADGMVLLKNNSTLPLDLKAKVALFGVRSYDFISGGTGSGDVNEAYTVGMLEGMQNAGFQIESGLNDIYKAYLDYQNIITKSTTVNRGWFWGKPLVPETDFQSNVYSAFARRNDVAVITLGRNSGEGADRGLAGDFYLTEAEKSLVSGVCTAFHAVNKKVVVILNVGGVIETASWKELPDAILLAWQPGQEGGNAVTDVLSGAVNPSGRLSTTWAVDYFDYPSSANFPYEYDEQAYNRARGEAKDTFPNVGRTYYNEKLNVGYRYFQEHADKVSFAFGYGLSYTEFAYSNTSVKKSGKNYVATVKITNTGAIAGKEVVQLYIEAPDRPAGSQKKELKAFAKTRLLQPGESQTVTMTFTPYNIAYYDMVTSKWITNAGTYNAFFMNSSADNTAAVPFKATAAGFPAQPGF
ncbi:MAG: glycoside hydrolase family 3 C-terminal domain-containing protein [Bacteroidaceae bacterium]|nr:glycoside hydrolase family 3 C-terminal domain-containing protein [Bacteroidaceae bacterium]